MNISKQQTHQGRFIERPGGVIIDLCTGSEVCRVAVDELHTFDAAEAVKTLIDALHEKHGRELEYRHYDADGAVTQSINDRRIIRGYQAIDGGIPLGRPPRGGSSASPRTLHTEAPPPPSK